MRTKKSISCQEELNDVMDKFIQTSDNIVLNYQLIADYDRRTMFVQEFEGRIGAYNNIFKDWMEVLCNNEYFTQWLSVIFVGLYMLKGGMAVIHGDVSLGIYLSEIAILKQAGT